MRVLAVFPLSVIAFAPPSFLAAYEISRQSTADPVTDSKPLFEPAAPSDSAALLSKAYAIAYPEALLSPSFSPTMPQKAAPLPAVSAKLSLPAQIPGLPTSKLIPDAARLPIAQIVAQSLGFPSSKVNLAPGLPLQTPRLPPPPPIALPQQPSPVITAQVEVPSQALPTSTIGVPPGVSTPTVPTSAAPTSAVSTPVRNTVSAPIPATALSSQSVDENYTLGAGDQIQINLFNVPEYSGTQQVLADGSVNLPLVGKVSVKDMTLPVAEAAIAARYEPELQYAVVTLILIKPRPLRIAISGEVQQPGSYTLSLTADSQFPSIAQAIQAAGGATQAADLRQVMVRRQSKGLLQEIRVNLWELLKNGDITQNLALRDGDSVMISAATEVNMAETAQLADSNLAASPGQTLDIAIVGEVFRPGAYRIGTDSTVENNDRPRVTQAIQVAGGVKPSANLRQVQVRRTTRSGGEQLINVDFWKLLQAGDASQNLVLQQGDTIVIPIAENTTPAESAQLASANLSPDVIQVNVVGEVKTPGAVQVPANTTLNQAILASGGLNTRSAKTVELIRLNPNGTITQQEIEVDLREGVDPERNPILWNNDVIIAGRSRSARIGDQLNSILGPVLQLISPIRTLFP
jgi:protein involved in polysaccharide export with SLBB domain